ncbi:MAG: YafY family transcriptional regulator [Bacteroidales bacterium]|nr:YafY family transcriptional regulator [Bacteroidales bacterium]
MNRLDRITSILVQLQSKKLNTAGEIAERFDVSIRTIYRDISTLRNAGVPIGEEEGKGYFITEGYRLPPVMFSPGEANAMVAAEKILHYHTEESLKKNFISALLKIKAILRDEEKDKLEYLESRIGIQEAWAPQSNYLSVIQDSIISSMEVKMTYFSRKEEETQRTIRPYALYFTGVVWNVIAYCTLREEIREFRLDKIINLATTSNSFEPDKTFKIEKYLEARAKRIFNP